MENNSCIAWLRGQYPKLHRRLTDKAFKAYNDSVMDVILQNEDSIMKDRKEIFQRAEKILSIIRIQKPCIESKLCDPESGKHFLKGLGSFIQIFC